MWKKSIEVVVRGLVLTNNNTKITKYVEISKSGNATTDTNAEHPEFSNSFHFLARFQ